MIRKETLLLVLFFVLLTLVSSAGVYSLFSSARESDRLETASRIAILEEAWERSLVNIDERLEQIESTQLKEKELRSIIDKSFEQRIGELQDDLTVASESGYDLSSIVKDWEDRIAVVECRRGNTVSRGSGLVMNIPYSQYISVITNKHLIGDVNGKQPYNDQTCFVSLLDSGGTFATLPQDMAVSPTEDIAYIEIKQPNQRLQQIVSETPRVCSAASSGDEIVVMGFPDIGARRSLTVTEGIISGYEDRYYITSAKVEQGNSGGVAVLAKENCYLGIPTFVRHGALESLARILDISIALRPSSDTF